MTRLKANNDTIFVVNDDDDVTAYTGIKNVPDITAKNSKNVRCDRGCGHG
ncbi:MAG: hypothetical protein ACLUJG_03065 [Lawsonibacter sp.]